jgi:hypothetical protein
VLILGFLDIVNEKFLFIYLTPRNFWYGELLLSLLFLVNLSDHLVALLLGLGWRWKAKA